MTLYSPRQSLVTKLAILAISSSKHGGQLLNEVFICSKDITPSPGYLKGWRIFKMTAVALGPKIFLRSRIQGF